MSKKLATGKSLIANGQRFRVIDDEVRNGRHQCRVYDDTNGINVMTISGEEKTSLASMPSVELVRSIISHEIPASFKRAKWTLFEASAGAWVLSLTASTSHGPVSVPSRGGLPVNVHNDPTDVAPLAQTMVDALYQHAASTIAHRIGLVTS